MRVLKDIIVENSSVEVVVQTCSNWIDCQMRHKGKVDQMFYPNRILN